VDESRVDPLSMTFGAIHRRLGRAQMIVDSFFILQLENMIDPLAFAYGSRSNANFPLRIPDASTGVITRLFRLIGTDAKFPVNWTNLVRPLFRRACHSIDVCS
jgi:hypothetical protein